MNLSLNLSKKQNKLIQLIISKNEENIEVLGSTQSGKTFSISLATILYAQELYKYAPNEKFKGAIIGWNPNAIKRNIADVMIDFLTKMGLKNKDKKGKGDYKFVWGQNEKYLQIYNITYYFFPFNNALSFNQILGGGLIFEWVDESARIYSQNTLQEIYDQLPGRQISYAGHPYLKRVNSFNVEGNENHPYKVKYLDNLKGRYLEFFPYDNPKIDTEDKIRDILNMFATKTLRLQKVFNKWVVAEGRVFTKINKIKRDEFQYLLFKEIGIGCDYGSTNATTFVPIALCYHELKRRWILVRLESYFHDSQKQGTTPTTEFFSKQLRLFLLYLKNKYKRVPIIDLVVDSEAKHFINRLDTDNIPNTSADKYPGSVKEGVEYMQSLYDKEYLYELEEDSICYIHDDLTVEKCERDEVLTETESYRYDKIKSIKTGVDCYVKEMDHSVDARRYLLLLWLELNKAPTL